MLTDGRQALFLVGTIFNSAVIYLLKLNNKDTRKTSLTSLLLTYCTPCSRVCIVNFEHIIAGTFVKDSQGLHKLFSGTINSQISQGLNICNFIKKRLQHRCFPVHHCRPLKHHEQVLNLHSESEYRFRNLLFEITQLINA